MDELSIKRKVIPATKAHGYSEEEKALLTVPGFISQSIRKEVLKKFGAKKLRELLQTEDASVLKAEKSSKQRTRSADDIALMLTMPHHLSTDQRKTVLKAVGVEGLEALIDLKNGMASPDEAQAAFDYMMNKIMGTMAGDKATVYKGQQVADDANRLPGGTAAAIERRTPIIEDTEERLRWYQSQLGMSDQLHFYFGQLLGSVDRLEDVYRLALSNQNAPYTPTDKARRKALSGSELIQLDQERLEAMNVPQAVILALGTVLQSKLSDFIKRLMQVVSIDNNTKSRAPEGVKSAVDPFFRMRVKI